MEYEPPLTERSTLFAGTAAPDHPTHKGDKGEVRWAGGFHAFLVGFPCIFLANFAKKREKKCYKYRASEGPF